MDREGITVGRAYFGSVISAFLLAAARFPRPSVLAGFDEPLIVLAMQVVVSLVVLTAGLYVILAQSYALDDKKWGYGIVGTVIGYWFKGPLLRSA